MRRMNFTEAIDDALAQAMAEERFSMLAGIAAQMRSIDPQFAIATEGMIDGLLESVSFFHGWGTGSGAPTDPRSSAPSMF